MAGTRRSPRDAERLAELQLLIEDFEGDQIQEARIKLLVSALGARASYMKEDEKFATEVGKAAKEFKSIMKEIDLERKSSIAAAAAKELKTTFAMDDESKVKASPKFAAAKEDKTTVAAPRTSALADASIEIRDHVSSKFSDAKEDKITVAIPAASAVDDKAKEVDELIETNSKLARMMIQGMIDKINNAYDELGTYLSSDGTSIAKRQIAGKMREAIDTARQTLDSKTDKDKPPRLEELANCMSTLSEACKIGIVEAYQVKKPADKKHSKQEIQKMGTAEVLKYVERNWKGAFFGAVKGKQDIRAIISSAYQPVDVTAKQIAELVDQVNVLRARRNHKY